MLKDVALEKDSIVNCDETWCKVRKYDHYKKCYIWVLVNKAVRTVIFFYEDGSRGRDVLTNFIADAELKSVMSDGYNAYVFIGDGLKSVKDKDPSEITPYLRAALNYLDRFWDSIFAFLKVGNLPIDNNLAERAVRPLTTQRNAMLHFGSDEGAEMTATYHSIISRVKMQGGSAWEYIDKFFY